MDTKCSFKSLKKINFLKFCSGKMIVYIFWKDYAMANIIKINQFHIRFKTD